MPKTFNIIFCSILASFAILHFQSCMEVDITNLDDMTYGSDPITTGGTGGGSGGGTITFDNEVIAAISATTGCSCHKGSLTGGFQIDDYNSLKARVIDGDAANSLVITYPNSSTSPATSHGGTNYDFSDSTQQDLFDTLTNWINEGALEN